MMMRDEEDKTSLREKDFIDRIKRVLANVAGYIIPLFMSAPGLYAGLMTLPFLAYLTIIVADLPFSQEAISYLLLGGSIFDNVVLLLGLVFLLYSVVFLWRGKSKELVTSGPYRIVRHPQYLSLIMFTAVLTSRSVWVLENTFGVGFLGVSETVVVWFLMVFVYIGLALFEERHLASVYQEYWADYRTKVGFLVPLLTSQQRWLDIATSVILLTGLMLSLLFFNSSLWFG